jgi:heme exporter protein B
VSGARTAQAASPATGPAVRRATPGFFAVTAALLGKDLRVEARARDTLPPMLAFAMAVALLLAFSLPGSGTGLRAAVALVPGSVPLSDVLAGFLWVTVLFAGLVGFARTSQMEREEEALDALLLAPVDRSALFVAKAAANLVYLAAVEVVLVPVFALLWTIRLGAGWGAFVAVTLLVDVGFVTIGTLFAALAAHTRSRELMLPILALPALVPVFIAAIELTSDLWSGGGFGSVAADGWFGILVAFDEIFAVVGALAFDYVLD